MCGVINVMHLKADAIIDVRLSKFGLIGLALLYTISRDQCMECLNLSF